MFFNSVNTYLCGNKTKKVNFMKMQIEELIATAEKLANNSSAIFCAAQARNTKMGNAKYWAMRSLAYSIGIFHPLYVANA